MHDHMIDNVPYKIPSKLFFFFFLMSLNIMLGLNVTPYANIRWATTIATESEHNMLVLSAETQFSRGF